MAYPYPNNMHNSPLQPPNIITMLGSENFDNPHQNFNMNHNMVPGMNDAPLEFNMNKNLPPIACESISDAELDDYESNSEYISASINDNRGKNKRRSHDRDNNRRRERKEYNDEKDRHNRYERVRSNYKNRNLENHPDSGSELTSEDIITDNNMQQNGIPPHPSGMIYGGMGMPALYNSGMMVSSMTSMMMNPPMLGMNQFAMLDNGNIPDAATLNSMPLAGTMGTPNPMPIVDGIPNPIGVMGMNSIPVGAVKETIHLKSCTMIPPYPNSAPPPTRDRPAGCRTVFVGGLPENITEEILTEVFETCGQITSLRLSKKNFCHIRFVYEPSVDRALYLSGYRIRIENKNDPANSARIHVDFAHARDDKYEWECKQRALQRAARHLERQSSSLIPSPPPINHFTEHEATQICEKIKQDENFTQAVQIVISWLERGDCTKKNVNVFYSMIQSTNSHVRRLLNEKTQYEEEVQRAKDEAKQKMQGILNQFSQVERVFTAASHKKVWDHFTKAQRKNIDMWKKQSSEIRSIQLEDFLQESNGGEEMDCSDNDDIEGCAARKNSKIESELLKEENDSLRCQLEAYKNEIHILKSETQYDMDMKNQNIKELQNQISSLDSQLTQSKRAQASEAVKLLAMEAKLQALEKLNLNETNKLNERENLKSELNEKLMIESAEPTRIPNNLTDREARLVGIISTFLHIHPFGASTDYVWSYVQKMEPQLTPNQIEDLLRKFPTLFIQEMSGVGANIERKWVFNGFNSSH